MRNEKGAVFPLTITFCLFLLIILINIIEVYRIDAHFIDEKVQLVQLQSLMQIGTIDILELINKDEEYSDLEGIFYYPNGNVQYSTAMFDDNLIKIHLACTTKEERRKNILFLYNKDRKELIRWAE